MGAAAALTLAAIYGIAWLLERRDPNRLFFCLSAVAIAGLARAEIGMMHAATPAEFGEWARWFHLPLFFVIAGLLLFVRSSLGTGRAWLLWAVISARFVVLVGNFLVSPTFNWRDIINLRRESFLGEQVSVLGDVVLRSWWWLPAASLLAAIVFLIDASVQRWRKGGFESRRKALAVGIGVTVPTTIAVLLAEPVVLGVAHLPVLGTPPFLVSLIVASLELGRQIVMNGRMRLELTRLGDSLAHAERVSALGQLASAISHDLLHPLASILINAEVLETHLRTETPDLEELRAIASDIRTQDMRATELIGRMRGLLKRRSIEMKLITLDDLVQDVISLVQSEAASKNVLLEHNLAPGLPRIWGDRVHLSQVLINLLVNGIDAVQSRPDNARHVVVEAHNGAAGEIEITVRDSGPGIPAAIIDKLFVPFFTTKPDGLGMGLAISRAIVQAHGGRLSAEPSALGGGATFRVILPVERQREPAEIAMSAFGRTTNSVT